MREPTTHLYSKYGTPRYLATDVRSLPKTWSGCRTPSTRYYDLSYGTSKSRQNVPCKRRCKVITSSYHDALRRTPHLWSPRQLRGTFLCRQILGRWTWFSTVLELLEATYSLCTSSNLCYGIHFRTRLGYTFLSLWTLFNSKEFGDGPKTHLIPLSVMRSSNG
jgi:hypothetical protein